VIARLQGELHRMPVEDERHHPGPPLNGQDTAAWTGDS
jgi:hypothetical protein